MIYIGICDDEKEHRELLKEMVVKTMFQYDEVEFHFYESGQQVITEIENGNFSCELLLLDIHMKDIDGLETAAYIRSHRVDVDIIFVTVSTEHVFDGYTYQAFSYLLKPLDYNRLSDELKRYMSLKDNCSKCLHVNVRGKKVQIFLDKVDYFMADGRKIIAYQKGETENITFYAKMSDLQETLKNDDFLRCHQSFLVNMHHIQKYSRKELDVGGNVVPVSRKYVDDVKECMERQEASR